MTAAGLVGRGSLSPTSSVADLRANRDATVDKFSVSISSFLLHVKMGVLGKTAAGCIWMRTQRSDTIRRTTLCPQKSSTLNSWR